MATRPFRFGAKATKATSGKEWADIARKAEDLGYVSLQMDDHFGNQLAPIPAITAALCATSTLEVGSLVLGNDFRNPVVLAKECATMDVLSDGRFTLGIGAGWMKEDYQIAGIDQPDANTRIERLGEAVQILRGLWGEGKFSFSGKHYTVAETDAKPKPAHAIPITIGGGGQKILTLAAQQADIVGLNFKIVARGINPRSFASTAADTMDEKIAWVTAAAGGRDPERSMQILVTMVTDTPEPIAENLSKAFGLPPEVILNAPFFQLGTLDKICENIQAARDRWGINYFAFQQDAIDAAAPIVSRLAGK